MEDKNKIIDDSAATMEKNEKNHPESTKGEKKSGPPRSLCEEISCDRTSVIGPGVSTTTLVA